MFEAQCHLLHGEDNQAVHVFIILYSFITVGHWSFLWCGGVFRRESLSSWCWCGVGMRQGHYFCGQGTTLIWTCPSRVVNKKETSLILMAFLCLIQQVFSDLKAAVYIVLYKFRTASLRLVMWHHSWNEMCPLHASHDSLSLCSLHGSQNSGIHHITKGNMFLYGF